LTIKKEHLINGAVHEGKYREGMKNGRGKFIWVDGSTYTGEL